MRTLPEIWTYFLQETVEQEIVEEVYNEYRETIRQHQYKQYIKGLIPKEDKIVKRFKPLFKNQRDEVLRNLYKTGGKEHEIKVDKKDPTIVMFRKDKWTKEFAEEGSAMYEENIGIYGREAFSQIGMIDLSFDIHNRRAERFIRRNGILFGRETQDTNYKNLKKSLSSGYAKGESIPKLANRVKEHYAGYVGDKPWKATRIARTEIIKASNFGRLEGYRQSGLVIGKSWLTELDELTRGREKSDPYSHVLMNAQRVKINDLFTEPLTGEQLDHPGDPDHGAGAGNLINCRCTFTPIIEGEEI